MKKVIIIATIITVCFLSFGCSNKNDSKKKVVITEVNNFKWGMTKKEVKKIIIEKEQYKYQTEFREEIDCSYNDSRFEYEMDLLFDEGLLSRIVMDVKCQESDYQSFVEDAKKSFKQTDTYTDNHKTDKVVHTLINHTFVSKTTEYQLEFREYSDEPKGIGWMSRCYYRN